MLLLAAGGRPCGSGSGGRAGKSAGEPGYQRPPEALPREPRHSPTWSVGMSTLRDTMAERRILETTQLLGALPPDALETLRQQATMRSVSRNEVLFRQGEPAAEMYGIVTGRVAVLTRSPDGRESLVAVLDEGSLLGELPLFDAGARSADARALEESQLIVLG